MIMANNERITRVALYARVSTEEQTENFSLAGQLDLLRKYAKENKFDVFDEYVDGGFSGTTIERPAFQRLLEDARKRNFQLILVYRVDRFFRNNKALLTLTEDLEKLGIFIRSLTEPFDTSTHMGKFVLSLFGSIAQLERDTFLERSKLGRQRRAKEGYYSGSNPAKFGFQYNRETQRLEVNDKEAEIVKFIFNEYIEPDSSMLQVVKKLHRLGHTTKTGLKFRTDTLHDILRDEVYTGRWHANRYCAGGKKQRPKDEWIEVQVPRIVEDDVFEKAQKLLSARRTYATRNVKYPYLLQGLIKCGCCGSTVAGNAEKYKNYVKGKEYGPYFQLYYRCTHAYKNVYEKTVDCDLRYMKAPLLEELVWQEIEKILLNPELILKALENQKLNGGKSKKDLENEFSKLTAQRQNLEQEEQRILEAYRRNIISVDQLDKQIKQIHQEKDNIEERKTEIDEVLNSRKNLKGENAIEYINQMKKGIKKYTFETKKMILKLLNTRMIANVDGNIDVNFSIPRDPENYPSFPSPSFLPSIELPRPTLSPLVG